MVFGFVDIGWFCGVVFLCVIVVFIVFDIVYC